jgi:hexosaminidase
VTVVPEIDVPGHTNAALASYGELNCDGRPSKPYTGIKVGFSSLCVDEPVTYRFLDEVFGELAAMTPGPYLHIGGDEVETLSERQYAQFIERVQQIVQGHGKRVIGWQEVTRANLLPDTVAQYWLPFDPPHPAVLEAARQGTKLILSPMPKAYLDAKYHQGTELGNPKFGTVEVRDAYDWEPPPWWRASARTRCSAWKPSCGPRCLSKASMTLSSWPSPGSPASPNSPGHRQPHGTGTGSGAAWPATGRAGRPWG